MKKDHVLIAGLIGGLSTIAGEIVTKLLVACGVGQYAVYELNSLLLTSDRPNFWIGLAINFIVGFYVGLIFYLAFRKIGDEHLVLKTTMGSFAMWLAFEAGFTVCIEETYIPMRSIADHFVHLAGTAAFGSVMGALLKVCLFKNKEKPG